MVTLRVLLFAMTLSFGKDDLNSRHRMGRHKKTAVVLIDCGFVSLMSATTIGMVTSGLLRSLNG